MPSAESALQRTCPLYNPGIAHPFKERAPRVRTFLTGKLVHGDGAFSVDCTVRDISEGGAKVMLIQNQSLPPSVFLVVVKYCTAYQSEIVWANFPARGLKFLARYKLDRPVPKNLKYLRRLWLELRPRSGIVW
jgi:hypothetical protein